MRESPILLGKYLGLSSWEVSAGYSEHMGVKSNRALLAKARDTLAIQALWDKAPYKNPTNCTRALYQNVVSKFSAYPQKTHYEAGQAHFCMRQQRLIR